MNLELLFRAYRLGGFPELYIIAESHALKSAAYHVRPDGSTIHVVDIDPDYRCGHRYIYSPGIQPRLHLVTWSGVGYSRFYDGIP